jgi:hypothetical protein
LRGAEQRQALQDRAIDRIAQGGADEVHEMTLRRYSATFHAVVEGSLRTSDPLTLFGKWMPTGPATDIGLKLPATHCKSLGR